MGSEIFSGFNRVFEGFIVLVYKKVRSLLKWISKPQYFKVRFFDKKIKKKEYLKEAILKYAPNSIHIELTNQCNLRCKMCPQYIFDKEVERGTMELNMFKEVVDSCYRAGVMRVILFNIGESFLLENIAKYIQIAKDKPIPYVELYSNGTLFNEKNVREVIDAGLDTLVLSLDSADPEIYERFRGVKIEKLKRSLKCFMSILNEYRRKRKKVPIIIFREMYPKGTKTLENKGKVTKLFYDTYKDLKPDYFFGIYYFTFGDAFTNNISMQYGIKSRFGEERKPCRLIWKQFTIGWNGKAVACCRDFKQELLIGDITKDSVLEIWNSDNMVGLRQKHLDLSLVNYNNCICCNETFTEVYQQ